MKIFKSIPAIIGEIGVIRKTRKENTTIKYAYRGIDEFMNALNPLLAKHCVTIMPEVLENVRETFTSSGGARMTNVVMRIKYTLTAEDGSSTYGVMVGEAFDSGDKASNKAMSIALKYFIMEVFMVPTEDIDDADDTDPTELKKGITDPHAPTEPRKGISTVKSELHGEAKKGAEYNNSTVSEAQIKRLWALQIKSGKSPKEISDKCRLLFNKEPKQLKYQEYQILCSWVEKGE